MNKKRIALLFGGKTSEHEVSLCSAGSVIQNLDKNQFEISPLYIDRQGDWWQYSLDKMQYDSDTNSILPQKEAPLFDPAPTSFKKLAIDVVFPVVHGSLCEDGSLQGFFEMMGLAYVSANVLGSALGMDKAISKILVSNAGVPVAPFVLINHDQWLLEQKVLLNQIRQKLKKPYFVKPANTGSSVGISKIEDDATLVAAIESAFHYHYKVIVEQGIQGREIEVSLLDSLEPSLKPLVSLPGEVKIKEGFYSYEKKYIHPEQVELIMPAQLTPSEIELIQKIAIQSYQALQTDIMARVDVFLEDKTGKVYFNEINTLPGFTKISMYPQLWGISGIRYSELLSRLVTLALARHNRR